jgi:opacity protein-like surface antigen
MKKTILFGVLIISLSGPASAAVSAGLRLAYFSPADADFRSIYGGGPLFAGELSIRLAPKFNLWLEGVYFGRTGSLSYTHEETRLSLVPVGLGVSYRILPGQIFPYAGAGIRLVFFREKNVLGDVKDAALGATVRAGLAVALSSRLGADLRVAYSLGQMQPADFKFSVGGLELGAGLAYSF